MAPLQQPPGPIQWRVVPDERMPGRVRGLMGMAALSATGWLTFAAVVSLTSTEPVEPEVPIVAQADAAVAPAAMAPVQPASQAPGALPGDEYGL